MRTGKILPILFIFVVLLVSGWTVQAADQHTDDAPTAVDQTLFQDQDFIVKAVDRPLATVGETLIYTITFRNPKSIPLTQVVVTDYYDARLEDVQVISGTVGILTINGNLITVQDFELAPGETSSLVIQARISERAQVGDLLASAATLESPNASIHVSNTVETAILPGALPSTGELSRAAWLIWRLLPAVLLISIGAFLAVSIRTYKRLRVQDKPH